MSSRAPRSTPERAARALGFALLLTGVASTTSCAGFLRWPWGSTQRVPGPMESDRDPLPPGDSLSHLPGPEEVLVLRHADPVQVRPAALTSSFPLSFHDKDLRVTAGSGVYSAPGGRAEVLWPGGNSVVLSGRSAGIVGSKSRGESAFLFRQIERAVVDFKSEDQVELVGGSRLSAKSGPFLLDHVRPDILRVKNQSKLAGEIAFRDAVLTLDPGEVVDLPLLDGGASPVQSDPGLATTQGPGFQVAWSGQVDVGKDPAAVRVRALGEHEVHALGLRVRMERDEEVVFHGVVRARGAAPAAPTPAPATTPAPTQRDP
ncbi:MAG: hypothetical protein IPJ77_12790 [Planctomycetes bacterium]|nr:hypothetical protein [Planctomycetota bacterium]